MNFSLGFLTIPECGPLEAARIAAASGYQSVGLRLIPVTENELPYELLTNKALQREFRQVLSDHALEVGDVELLRIFPHSKPEDFLPLLDTAHFLAARKIVTISEDEDFSRVTDLLHELMIFCRERDLFLELEPITWTRVHILDGAARLIHAVSDTRLGLLVDALHWHRSGSTLGEFRALRLPAPRLVHFCDAVLPTFSPSPEALKREAREQRLFPGQGELDLNSLLELTTHETVVSLEIPNLEYRRLYGPGERAERALKNAQRFFSRFR